MSAAASAQEERIRLLLANPLIDALPDAQTILAAEYLKLRQGEQATPPAALELLLICTEQAVWQLAQVGSGSA